MQEQCKTCKYGYDRWDFYNTTIHCRCEYYQQFVPVYIRTDNAPNCEHYKKKVKTHA